ncbi:catalase family protein [soil metagenome]
MQASTDWTEQIAPDETERFQRYANDFAAMQKHKSQRFGNGRALHRKQLLALRAHLDVLTDLPEAARHGLFAVPGRHEAWLRLSNGGTDRAANATPDIRGFAIKVFGVDGPSALGTGPAASQDFLLINHSTFGFPNSDEFVGLVMAASKGGGSLLKYLFGRYGLFGAIGVIRGLKRALGKPFGGFAFEQFHTASPIACGPYAARVRLVPCGNPAAIAVKGEWAQDVKDRLAKAPLLFDFQLQFFVDEVSTPIENPSVEWEPSRAPFVTVARLEIPQQDFASEEAARFAEQVEAARFDPWSALMAHRPLGDVMRARKVVYFASGQTRATS